ncbi:hypothetical protein DL767_010493 [Monosporascus sp. MG133]|nr:hypothetical protein DL767_010493 [Monosporascus sp. MG133]
MGTPKKIWENFLNRLKLLGEESNDTKAVEPLSAESRKQKREDDDGAKGIDFDDIECYLTDLADEEMNGCQIRNVIMTARQLAKFKKVKMSSTYLKHVIKVLRRFNRYLQRVQEGYTDDQFEDDPGRDLFTLWPLALVTRLMDDSNHAEVLAMVHQGARLSWAISLWQPPDTCFEQGCKGW